MNKPYSIFLTQSLTSTRQIVDNYISQYNCSEVFDINRKSNELLYAVQEIRPQYCINVVRQLRSKLKQYQMYFYNQIMTIEKCMLIDIDYLMKCVKEDCRDNEGILIGQIEGEIYECRRTYYYIETISKRVRQVEYDVG